MLKLEFLFDLRYNVRYDDCVLEKNKLSLEQNWVVAVIDTVQFAVTYSFGVTGDDLARKQLFC